MKDSAEYGVAETRPVLENGTIIRDEIILLSSQQEIGPEARLRRIEVWVEEKQETMVFLTNDLKLAASTIAAIYKERWQIELFFKALKQSLKIKTFVGTTENATHEQIWTALLMLKYLQLKSTFHWSLSNLVNSARRRGPSPNWRAESWPPSRCGQATAPWRGFCGFRSPIPQPPNRK